MLRNWTDWVGTFTGVVALTVVALPVAVLAVLVLGWRRSRSWRTAIADVGLVYGTVPTVWLTLLPGNSSGGSRVSLVPFRDLAAIIAHGPASATLQIVGNLLVFAALGFFVPMRFAVSVPRVLALACACSVLVETAQYAMQSGRVSSVDDVLLNTVGAGLAALAARGLGFGYARADRGGRALPGRGRP